MKKKDLYSSLFFLGVGVVFIIGSLDYPFWDHYGPGAGLFPLLLGILFAILSLLLLGTNLLRKTDKGVSSNISAPPSKYSDIGRVILYLIFLFCFYFILMYAGYLVSVFLFMLGILLFNKRSMKLSFSISFLTTVVSYILFIKLLQVPLPGGVFETLMRF